MTEIKVGDIVRVGKKSAIETNLKEGQILVFEEGIFECDNGLYTYDQSSPSIVSPDEDDDYDSIFHLFGNDLSKFLDSEIIGSVDESFFERNALKSKAFRELEGKMMCACIEKDMNEN